MAARRLPSNSQKLITNLFYGEKGSLIPTTERRQRKKDLFQKSSHNGTRTRERDFSEKTIATTSRRCRRDRYWFPNTSLAVPPCFEFCAKLKEKKKRKGKKKIAIITNFLRLLSKKKNSQHQSLNPWRRRYRNRFVLWIVSYNKFFFSENYSS